MKSAVYKCRQTGKTVVLIALSTRPPTTQCYVGMTNYNASTAEEYAAHLMAGSGYREVANRPIADVSRDHESKGLQRIL